MAADDATVVERMIELERKVARIEARAEVREKREQRIEAKLDTLIEAENRRSGREDAERLTHREQREDRSERNEWVRAAAPTGLWSMFYGGVVWLVVWLRDGGP